jgi:hypothetical protein
VAGYWLSRLVFERLLAGVYVVAFLVAANQFRALLGRDGLTPIPQYVQRTAFRRAPSLFQLHYSDRFFAAVSWFGVLVSLALVAGAADLVPIWAYLLLWLAPWVAYVSIVNVGQVWYGFGWESLLCEVGWYALLLAPVAPMLPALLVLRWLLFRLEFGAGLIKLRGDRCWRNLTCLNYHHETQPMPGPLSWYFHRLPPALHRVEVAANHVTQLVVPFLLFTPQPVASVAAAIMIATQLWLVASGNFAWLNVLTIVIAASVVGGEFWHELLGVSGAHVPEAPGWYAALVWALTAVVVLLSYRPARNLVSRRQEMNRSFDPLHLVNAYGAFGNNTRVRHEIVLEGTSDPDPGRDSVWQEYEFRAKPGDVYRRPPQFAPYHLRLDWLMWFAALSPAYARTWLPDLAAKLLAGDRATLKLLGRNPFAESPPRWIRARYYRYRFTTLAERRRTGAWWYRTLVGDYLPQTSRQSPPATAR